MQKFVLNVNGETKEVNAHADSPLLWVLRDHLDLVGTKYGCGIAQCGACTVHLDGKPARACQVLVSAVGDSKVKTIEGLSKDATHVLQDAWREHDVPQCGYCQAGQIMSAASLLERNANPSDEEIDSAMAGNLCRCGTYLRVKAAIKTASSNL